MPINKGEIFSEGDVFVDYPYESVMFRWDHRLEKIYRKFYGEDEDDTLIPYDHPLYNEALLYGNQITREQYEKGADADE